MLGDNDVMATVAVKSLAAGRKFYEGKLASRSSTPKETRPSRTRAENHSYLSINPSSRGPTRRLQ